LYSSAMYSSTYSSARDQAHPHLVVQLSHVQLHLQQYT
jgi:hypothetical protein